MNRRHDGLTHKEHVLKYFPEAAVRGIRGQFFGQTVVPFGARVVTPVEAWKQFSKALDEVESKIRSEYEKEPKP